MLLLLACLIAQNIIVHVVKFKSYRAIVYKSTFQLLLRFTGVPSNTNGESEGEREKEMRWNPHFWMPVTKINNPHFSISIWERWQRWKPLLPLRFLYLHPGRENLEGRVRIEPIAFDSLREWHIHLHLAWEISDEKYYSLRTNALNARAWSSNHFHYRMLLMHGNMILNGISRKHEFFQTEIPEFEVTPLTFSAGFIIPFGAMLQARNITLSRSCSHKTHKPLLHEVRLRKAARDHLSPRGTGYVGRLVAVFISAFLMSRWERVRIWVRIGVRVRVKVRVTYCCSQTIPICLCLSLSLRIYLYLHTCTRLAPPRQSQICATYQGKDITNIRRYQDKTVPWNNKYKIRFVVKVMPVANKEYTRQPPHTTKQPHDRTTTRQDNYLKTKQRQQTNDTEDAFVLSPSTLRHNHVKSG
jgi:hypothetical protein